MSIVQNGGHATYRKEVKLVLDAGAEIYTSKDLGNIAVSGISQAVDGRKWTLIEMAGTIGPVKERYRVRVVPVCENPKVRVRACTMEVSPEDGVIRPYAELYAGSEQEAGLTFRIYTEKVSKS